MNFMIFNFCQSLSTAISKGAKVRVIATKTEMHPITARKLQNLIANPNFEIKFVDATFDFGMAICDNKEVNISISDKEVPSLGTNNRQILKMTQMMFENEWNANEKCLELIFKKELDPVKTKR